MTTTRNMASHAGEAIRTSRRIVASMVYTLAFTASLFGPSAVLAAINLAWSCPAATAGSTVTSCPGDAWSWQVGATGLMVASAATTGAYESGTWRLWQNVPSSEYVYVCTADVAVGASEGCPSPGVYTHELYVQKSVLLGDTQVPSTPAGPAATAISSAQVNLSWTASTDNLAVIGYAVERCQGAGCSSFSQIGTTSSTTYIDTGRTGSTTYVYRVRARDAVPNWSSYSATASATTLAPGTSGPIASNLVWTCPAAAIGSNAGDCPSGVGTWQIAAAGLKVASSAVYGYLDAGTWQYWETVPSNYYVFVCTVDRAVGAPEGCPTDGTYTEEEYVLKSTLTTADTQAPTVPSGFSATAASSTQINLSWTASTDNVAVTGYAVERCQGAGCSNFSQIATPTGTTYSDTGVSAATTYLYRVRARDAVPNWSGYSTTASATTPPAVDTQAPTAPSGLSATAVSTSQIDLSWSASTDNVAVTGYAVERCQGAGCSSFSQIATPTTTTYSDTGRTASTTYVYRIRARDAVPNWSGYSSTTSATTFAAPDTQAPTAPTGLTISAGANQLALSWTASTDNVAVVAYLIERCQGLGCSSFAQIDTTSNTAYTDSSAIAGLSYSYRVRARDAVQNYSAYSSVVAAVPADCD